jgi:hypothetical protein
MSTWPASTAVAAGPQLQHFAGEIGRGAGAGARPVELAGVRLRLGDQLGHALDFGLRGKHEGVGRRADHHHGDEILERIIARLRVQARIDHIGARADQQGVAVAGRARRGRNADIAAGAAAVLDDDRLAQGLAELGVDQPGRDVGAAAGREAGDDGDLSLGIVRARGVERCACEREQDQREQGTAQDGARDIRRDNRHRAFLRSVSC